MNPKIADKFFAQFSSLENKLATHLECQSVITYLIEQDAASLYTKIVTDKGISQEIHYKIDNNTVAGSTAVNFMTIRGEGIGSDTETFSNQDTQHDNSLDQVIGFRIHSLMSVPVILENKMIGVLQAVNHQDGHFTRKSEANAVSVAKQLARIFSNNMLNTGPYDLLIQKGLLTRDMLSSIQERAESSEASIGFLLMREQRIGIDDIGESLEQHYQLPFVHYDPNNKPDEEILQRFKPDWLRSKGWIPLAENENSVTVVVGDPTDIAVQSELEAIFNPKEIILRVGIPEDYFQLIEASRQRGVIDQSNSVQAAITQTLQTIRNLGNSDKTEVINLVNRIIFEGFKEGASDIHVQTNGADHDADLLFRIDGECEIVGHIPHAFIDNVITRIKIMSGLNIAEKRIPQDGKAKVVIEGHDIELRVATIPNVTGRETAVLRILTSAKPLKLTELDFSERNLERVRQMALKPHGMFLVVGPTGSGKTTTLHSILSFINVPGRVIWTAEDPVEITQLGLQQVQIKPKIGFDFTAALRAFLRADPDVIMIGEIRDKDTAEISIKASLTGHLLFSTLHTNSATETITRVLDLGIDPFSFADAILGVLSQRLVRRLCTNCKTSRLATADELTYLREKYGEQRFDDYQKRFGEIHLHTANGCEKCNQNGYKGRIGIHELLVNNDEIMRLISARAATDDLKQAAVREGMSTLLQDGIEKVLSGIIDLKSLKQTLGS